MRLVLASQSPRRQAILTAAGFTFTVRPPRVDEIRLRGESPQQYVQRLARAKARVVAAEDGEVVLSADTVVTFENHLLEKPRDPDDAARMLALLSGREHSVFTGFCLRTGTQEVLDLAVTRVWFSELSAAEIAAYVATREPTDKAGAYAIQGLASKFIERIEGCYFNVVGLPVALVYRRLKEIGFSL